MLRVLLIFIGLFTFCNINSDAAITKLLDSNIHQENEDKIDSNLNFKTKIKLTPYIPDYKDLGVNGRTLVANRLNSILSQFEDCNTYGDPRFIIGAAINLVEKKVISGKKIRFSNTYEITLTSADIVSKTIFATYTTTIKGLDDAPVKTFINGFRAVNFENKEFIKFLSKTQNQIYRYYDYSCANIINDAQAEAGNKNYDAAYLILKNIPEKSLQCQKQSIGKKEEYGKKHVNLNCRLLADKMKTELARTSATSASGFNEYATAYYLLIDKKSPCFPKADTLFRNYITGLDSIARIKWETKLKQYQQEIINTETGNAVQDSSKELTANSYFDILNGRMRKAEADAYKKLIKKYHIDDSEWISNTFHTEEYEPFNRNDY